MQVVDLANRQKCDLLFLIENKVNISNQVEMTLEASTHKATPSGLVNAVGTIFFLSNHVIAVEMQ